MSSPTARGVDILFVWSVIVLCFCMLLINEYLCMSHWWIFSFLPEFALPAWRSKATSITVYPPVLLDTFFVKQILFTWVPYLAIALLAIWLRNPPFRKSREEEIGHFDPTALHEEQSTRSMRRLKEQAKKFFLYQLPPRRMWAFLLDGGFNVVDLIVVSLWASLNGVWLYLSFQLNWLYYYDQYKAGDGWPEGETRTTIILESLGYAGAWAAVYNLIFLFMPIPRNSFLQYLFNADFSTLIRYHRWLGHGTLWITLLHGVWFYAKWFCISRHEFVKQTFDWQYTGGINYLAGSISFFPFGLMLWITTFPWIRRRFFKIFLSTHIIGFLGFYIFLEIHYPPSIWYLPGLVLYFLDVTFRLSQWGVTSGVQCKFISIDKTFVTLSLKFNKATKATASQFIFLNVPSVSRWQWHPISIADVRPGADGLSQDITLHMKAYGSWTKKVIKQIATHGTIPVRADGPYGTGERKPEWAAHDTLVLIAGGIGITPLLGMLREMQALHREHAAAESKDVEGVPLLRGLPAQVNLIWAVRQRDELQLLDPDLLATAGQSGSWLKLNLFHTRHAVEYTDVAATNGSLNIPAHGIPASQPLTRQLQPYGFGDLHWAVAHVLAMVGAFFACLLVNAWAAEGDIISEDSHGSPVWGVGLVMALALVVGAMGLPALIIFPFHMMRYRQHVSACEAAYNSGLAETNGHANGGRPPHQNGHGMISEEKVHSLLPNDRERSGALDLESGKAAAVSTGRPNFTQLIAGIVSEHPQDQRIGVIASGPASLVVDARLATHEAGPLAAKLGMRGIPELAFSNHSFTF